MTAGTDSAANIKAHMAFLADDRLKGREAGTPEYDIAADYVAGQMKKLGLKPMGEKGGYFQTVPLVAARARDEGKIALKDASGKVTPLAFGTDYVSGGDEAFPRIRIDAPLVFVGYGLVAPEHGRDDYKGLDVKGKIVVALAGAPKFLQTEERAYYRTGSTKLKAAKDRGAVGYISLTTLTGEKLYPFPNRVRQYKSWGMSWRMKNGKAFTQVELPLLAGISVDGAKKFLGDKTDAILAQAETKDGNVKGFALDMSLSAALDSETKTIDSRNIVGLLAGQRSQAEGRIYRAVGASGPYRRHPAGEGQQRHDQQWRAGQCGGRCDHVGSGAPVRRQAGAALADLPGGYRRGKGPDRRGIFRPQSAGADFADRRRCGSGHADPHLRFHRCGGVRRRSFQHRPGDEARRRAAEREAIARSDAR